MSNTEHITKFTNADNGIETSVVKTPRGFVVSLFDLDGNVQLPTLYVYPTLDRAISEAEKIAFA